MQTNLQWEKQADESLSRDEEQWEATIKRQEETYSDKRCVHYHDYSSSYMGVHVSKNQI